MNSSPEYDTTLYLHEDSFDYGKWLHRSKRRQVRANARERRRRTALDSALELLRQRVPYVTEGSKPLSKIEILRLAREYISSRSEYLEDSPVLPYQVSPTASYEDTVASSPEDGRHPDILCFEPLDSIDNLKDPSRFVSADMGAFISEADYQCSLPAHYDSVKQTSI